jgi:hypothetical protein
MGRTLRKHLGLPRPVHPAALPTLLLNDWAALPN